MSENADTYVRSAESEELSSTDFGTKPILVTVAVTTGTAVVGNGILWVGAATHSIDKVVFWPPIFAIVVTVVGLVSFGGFYVAARRARVAIAACVVCTFIVMLVFSLTITALNDTAQAKLAADLISDFRAIVLTVVGFYFGTETVLSVTKIVAARGASPALRASIGAVDRDLPTLS